VVFNWPILLMPLHIVFIELIVDPACSIAFEAEREEPGAMQRKPRDPEARLFSRRTLLLGILQGLGLFVSVLAAFVLALRWGHTAEYGRAIGFTTLVIGNLTLIWANISSSKTVVETGRTRNVALWLVTIGTLATLAIVVYVPYLRLIFEFSVLHPVDLLVAFSLGAASITWFEILKLRHRTKQKLPRMLVGDRSKLKHVAVVAIGWLFVIAGIVGLVLPILQGILFLLIGLAILSKEYRWAGRIMARLRVRFPGARGWIKAAQARALAIFGRRTSSRC
jgi:hypothetical protein